MNWIILPKSKYLELGLDQVFPDSRESLNGDKVTLHVVLLDRIPGLLQRLLMEKIQNPGIDLWLEEESYFDSSLEWNNQGSDPV